MTFDLELHAKVVEALSAAVRLSHEGCIVSFSGEIDGQDFLVSIGVGPGSGKLSSLLATLPRDPRSTDIPSDKE